MSEFIEKLKEKIDSAARLEHPERQMRITLECGHYRLMSYKDCQFGGIGWSTACKICSTSSDNPVSRLIVNQEETGVL